MNKTIERDKQRITETTDTSAKVISTCSAGDCWRQGDLQIRFLGEQKPKESLSEVERPSQLAPGTTKGSRHILLADDSIKAYELGNPSPLEGPVLHCPDGLTVEHPEHGNITMKEPGWYAVTYQRAFAEELKRQAD